MTGSTLEQAVIAYGKEHIDRINDWYQWRDINQSLLPKGVTLPQGNHYTQNVSLKKQLSDLFANGNDEDRQQLTHYYIAIWGGVKGNRPERINKYALSEPEELINNGSKGIASWSKALCIKNPDRYAIYDARVAVSLNAIQMAYTVNQPRLFPLLSSQNKSIIKGSKKLKDYARDNSWFTIPDNAFYTEYNQMLSVVANRLGVRTFTLEMLLFAKPIELLGAAFPNDH